MDIKRDSEFKGKYKEIIDMMGFNEGDDLKSRDLLDGIIGQKVNYSLDHQLNALESLFGKFDRILILGGGPDSAELCRMLYENRDISELPISEANISEMHISEMIISELLKNTLVVAVDGASELLGKYKVIPHIIVSDLDGIEVGSVVKREYSDSFFIIHAHGDNIDKIERFKDFLQDCDNIIGTTQVDSTDLIINHGGFTDGDRALFLVSNFVSAGHRVFLVGYDFGMVAGGFSKPHYDGNQRIGEIKRKKLRIGAELTREICHKFPCTVNFLELNQKINSSISHENVQLALSNIKIMKIREIHDLKGIF